MIEPGDVVNLNGHASSLVVESINGNQSKATCLYYNDSGEVVRQDIGLVCLEKEEIANGCSCNDDDEKEEPSVVMTPEDYGNLIYRASLFDNLVASGFDTSKFKAPAMFEADTIEEFAQYHETANTEDAHDCFHDLTVWVRDHGAEVLTLLRAHTK